MKMEFENIKVGDFVLKKIFVNKVGFFNSLKPFLIKEEVVRVTDKSFWIEGVDGFISKKDGRIIGGGLVYPFVDNKDQTEEYFNFLKKTKIINQLYYKQIDVRKCYDFTDDEFELLSSLLDKIKKY